MPIPITTNLAVAYESSDIAGLSDGDLVSTWTDSSGNGGPSATASGSDRPTYKTNISKRQPAVRFSGSNFMSMGNTFSIGNNCTVFAVFAPDDITTRRTLLGQGNTASAFQLEMNGTGTAPTRGTIINGTFISYGASAVIADKSGFYPIIGKAEILTYRRNGAGATHTQRLNRNATTLTTNATNSFSGNGTKEIGRRAAASQFFDGDLFALFIYTATLTDGEVEQVEDYLAEKYYVPPDVQFLSRASGFSGTGNAQGVAFDGTYYYFSRSMHLSKYTRSGDTYTLVTGRDVTSDDPSDNTQINGMDVHDGYLWIGASNYPTEPRKGWVLKYNLSDLTHVATYPVEAHHSEGGAWKDGEFWVVYNDYDHISRYDDTFTLIGNYSLPLHPGLEFNYQDAAWLGNLLLTPLHGTNAPNVVLDVHRWNGSSFSAVDSLLPPSADAGQGLCWDGTAEIGGFLLFAERKASESGAAKIVRAQYHFDAGGASKSFRRRSTRFFKQRSVR